MRVVCEYPTILEQLECRGSLPSCNAGAQKPWLASAGTRSRQLLGFRQVVSHPLLIGGVSRVLTRVKGEVVFK